MEQTELEEGQVPSEEQPKLKVQLTAVAVAREPQELAQKHLKPEPESEVGEERDSRSVLIPHSCSPPGVELESRSSCLSPN